jgi:pimeloyl-ACP methyl ester carboxylesterase
MSSARRIGSSSSTRGHDLSDKSTDLAAYRASRMASDVVAVFDELALACAHFFGYSMGGKIGFAHAQDAASRFFSLTIGGDGGRERWPVTLDTTGSWPACAQTARKPRRIE